MAPEAREPAWVRHQPNELSDRDLLLAVYERLGSVQSALSMWRWIFGSTVVGGVGWLSWLTAMILASGCAFAARTPEPLYEVDRTQDAPAEVHAPDAGAPRGCPPRLIERLDGGPCPKPVVAPFHVPEEC